MTTEADLWKRLRDAVGRTGHWERREFNPVEGVPDVSYCVDGVEGHIELKQINKAPARDTTAVFGARTAKGMRDSQIAWFQRRLAAGGRAYILAQVGPRLFLHRGHCAPLYNGWTLPLLKTAACWSIERTASAHDWARFIVEVTGKF